MQLKTAIQRGLKSGSIIAPKGPSGALKLSKTTIENKKHTKSTTGESIVRAQKSKLAKKPVASHTLPAKKIGSVSKSTKPSVAKSATKK
jgi:hypothetical protein